MLDGQPSPSIARRAPVNVKCVQLHFAEFLRSQVPYAVLPGYPGHQYECINHRASFYVIFLETVSAAMKNTTRRGKAGEAHHSGVCDDLPSE